jgi:hypothetical protein
MGDGYHFEGDPATESTRRHMERVLSGEPRRRWPWIVGMFVGGTAFAFWRVRKARGHEPAGTASPHASSRAVRS